MAYHTVRKHLLESCKFLLSVRKFLLQLLQEKDILVQAKLCLERFLFSKKWLIWQISKILLERSNLLLFLSFFFLIWELHFLLCTPLWRFFLSSLYLIPFLPRIVWIDELHDLMKWFSLTKVAMEIRKIHFFSYSNDC